MGIDDQLLAALKRRRATLLASGASDADVLEVEDELARVRGETPAKKIRKRAAATDVETVVDVPDAVETASGGRRSRF